MKRMIVFVALGGLGLLALAGCGSQAAVSSTASQTYPGYATVTATFGAGSVPVPAMTTTAAYGEAVGVTDIERMIVRNGSLTLLVEDIPSALDEVTGITSGLQGYVVSSQSWRGSGRVYGSISIRVPAASFDNAMNELAGLAVEVTSRSTSSQDVTAEYIDLSARLNNLEATEKQLLSIMEQAQEIDDVLAVQRELTTVRQDIEQTKGRMQYLETTAAMSLINISLEQSSLGLDITAARSVVEQVRMCASAPRYSAALPPSAISGTSVTAEPAPRSRRPTVTARRAAIPCR